MNKKDYDASYYKKNKQKRIHQVGIQKKIIDKRIRK
jgi:hypothetical protein